MRASPVVRVAALGGVVGPALFIGAWTVSAAVTGGEYSSVDDAISRLAAADADTRVLMTAGFIGFGLALPAYGWALRQVLGGAAWVTATAAGIATLAVAATPLDRSASLDTWHGLFAGIGYVTLAATPLLAAGPLLRRGHHVLGALGLVASIVSGVALALTATDLPTGLFQRLGLTAADAWIVGSRPGYRSWAGRGSPSPAGVSTLRAALDVLGCMAHHEAAAFERSPPPMSSWQVHRQDGRALYGPRRRRARGRRDTRCRAGGKEPHSTPERVRRLSTRSPGAAERGDRAPPPRRARRRAPSQPARGRRGATRVPLHRRGRVRRRPDGAVR